MLGFFHLKITLSYNHMLDLVPSKYKSLMTTIITAHDAGTSMFACLFFKFVKPNQDLLFTIHFWLGFTSCALYLLFVPESPRWLLLKKGINS